MTGWTKLNAALQWGSLKTRVTLLSLAIFLAGIWSMSLYAIDTLRDDMQRVLGDQQFSIVSMLAEEIAHELDDRLKALETVAETITPALLRDAAALQATIEQRPVLAGMFNGGIVALGPDGVAIADVPRTTGRVGIDYLEFSTVAAALKEGKSSVGQPVMGRKIGVPVFGMSAPIRDAQGKVIGAVSGVINLTKPNFLDKIAQGHYGKTGGYMLVAKQQRQVVSATDRRLIMASLPASGSNSLIDRFIQGYEGSGVTVNPLGIEVLGSAKGIPVAGWYVAVALPTAEAFAPIGTMQQRMLLATTLLTVLVAVLTWWMLRRALSPMLSTVDKLAAMGDADEPLHPLPTSGQSEIAQLIGGFNRLLEVLAQREASLRESEGRYRSVFEFSRDAIVVHRNDLIIFANEGAARLFRAESTTALLGHDWHELIAPEDWPVTEMRVAALVSGEESYLPPRERNHVTLDGQTMTMESTGTRIVFDRQPAVLSVFRDITERRRAEQQRLADARLQRDTLVREVHHRIKNNLQSVAGLLQRELGQFVELNPRLETAISQVHAIAMVHGLQSADPDESIRLCDNVRSICKTVSDLSQRQVQFHIEHEQTSFRPVRVENSEAVSVALVFNELILNAVKHSPPASAAPTVSLSADGSSAQLLIRNAFATAPEFDIATGRGLGTGLRLVLSLLPNQGAHLVYELDTEGFMLTRLTLTAPVVTAARQRGPQRP